MSYLPFLPYSRVVYPGRYRGFRGQSLLEVLLCTNKIVTYHIMGSFRSENNIDINSMAYIITNILKHKVQLMS